MTATSRSHGPPGAFGNPHSPPNKQRTSSRSVAPLDGEAKGKSQVALRGWLPAHDRSSGAASQKRDGAWLLFSAAS